MLRFLRAFACACVIAGIAAPAALAATEPTAATGNATAITVSSATLNGTVNPEGQATTYHFEFGTTTSYGNQTTTTDAGSGTADVKVSAPLGGLTPNTTYHYRLVASNASGTALGADVSFKTPKPPAPTATTGRPTGVTQTAATLRGTVNPEGQATEYVFQYGTNTAYGNQTRAVSAGSGTKGVTASTAIGPLAPGTTYHYRLAATSANGTTFGHDVSFKTVSSSSGVTLAASAGTITFGQATTLSGRVLSPRPSHPPVILQRASSALGPWSDAGSTAASSSGTFAFAGLVPSANTYYRVLSNGATSAGVLVSVRFRVGMFVSRRHPPAGAVVQFHGRVAPGSRGHVVLIQRLGPRGRWHTVRRTRLRGVGPGFPGYKVGIRIDRTGLYRVLAGPDATHAGGQSRVVRIRVR